MVTNFYVKDLPETMPPSEKSLISASKVNEDKDPVSPEVKAKLASDAAASADIKEILNRQDLKFKNLTVSVDFKDNLSDADLAAIPQNSSWPSDRSEFGVHAQGGRGGCQSCFLPDW